MKFTQKNPEAIIPKRQTAGSAGYDLYASEDAVIAPNSVKIIGTGVGTELSPGYVAFVCSRSGLAAKNGVAVLNAPGIIDEDYQQEIKVILMNFGVTPLLINKGDRIAQLVLTKYETGLDSGSENFAQRQGGLGSTGVSSTQGTDK